MVSTNAIVDAVQAALLTIPEIGQVDTVQGARSPWSKNSRPAFMWAIEAFSNDVKMVANPGTANMVRLRKSTTVLLEAWYPSSVEKDSQTTWTNMTDAVEEFLLTQETLGLQMIRTLGPNLMESAKGMKSSLNQSDQPLLCHYARYRMVWAEEPLVESS